MLNCQKDLFSLDSNITYLNCAYKAPLLKKGEKELFKANNYFEITEKIRYKLSNIIGSHSNEIAILPSTSYGFGNVFNNIKINGSHAIAIENEFPSGYFATKNWCAKNSIYLRTIKRANLSAKEWNKKIIDSINIKTNIVLLSSIHWMNGTKLMLKEIGDKCKKVGAYFIVDGTQSFGASQMDVKKLNIDALICAGYKWLISVVKSSL